MSARKSLAAALTAGWEFVRAHPRLSLVLSVLMAAACAGGIYLILQQLPPDPFRLPCFTGGCGG